jgi:hypothetical protein
MMRPLSSSQRISAALPTARTGFLVGIVAGVVGAGLLVGSLALWAAYGTAVFFETIVSGLEACF